LIVLATLRRRDKSMFNVSPCKALQQQLLDLKLGSQEKREARNLIRIDTGNYSE
jgi:hypothetical protein